MRNIVLNKKEKRREQLIQRGKKKKEKKRERDTEKGEIQNYPICSF